MARYPIKPSFERAISLEKRWLTANNVDRTMKHIRADIPMQSKMYLSMVSKVTRVFQPLRGLLTVFPPQGFYQNQLCIHSQYDEDGGKNETD